MTRLVTRFASLIDNPVSSISLFSLPTLPLYAESNKRTNTLLLALVSTKRVMNFAVGEDVLIEHQGKYYEGTVGFGRCA